MAPGMASGAENSGLAMVDIEQMLIVFDRDTLRLKHQFFRYSPFSVTTLAACKLPARCERSQSQRDLPARLLLMPRAIIAGQYRGRRLIQRISLPLCRTPSLTKRFSGGMANSSSSEMAF